MQQPWGMIKAIYNFHCFFFFLCFFVFFFFLCTTKLSPTIAAFFSGSRLLTWTKTCVQSSSALPAALLYVTLPLTAALPLLPPNHMVIAKMSIYKRMSRACCFDCGRSERDCSCMSGRVRGNVDTLERNFPLSSVSVNDCSTSFRACKFNLNTHSSMSVLVCGNRPCVLCCALWSRESSELMLPSYCGLVCDDMLPVFLCIWWEGFPFCPVLCFLW